MPSGCQLLGTTLEQWAQDVLVLVRNGPLVVGCSVGGSCAREVARAAPTRSTDRAGIVDHRSEPRSPEAASRYAPLERLAVPPQWFATSVLGNALTLDDERAKLRPVAEAARKVWTHGGAGVGVAFRQRCGLRPAMLAVSAAWKPSGVVVFVVGAQAEQIADGVGCRSAVVLTRRHRSRDHSVPRLRLRGL
jgi:hypothetical protein